MTDRPIDETDIAFQPIPPSLQTTDMSGVCGTCMFSRKQSPTDFTSPNMMCCRFPPTVVPIVRPDGKLAGGQGMFPPVLRSTPACGEYRPRITQ